MSLNQTQYPAIVHSCYYDASAKGEQFVPDHVFSYQVSGTMIIRDGNKEYVFPQGVFRFFQRNQLARYTKLPPPDGEFRTVAIRFDQQVLREFSLEYGYTASQKYEGEPFLELPDSEHYKGFMDSLLPYLQTSGELDKELVSLKQKEALLVLLKVNPELADILFDFAEPGKIDLAGFMNDSYRFNVSLERYAYLSGRSLATFKRDFKKLFRTTPGRWLIKRRLEEAFFLIREKNKRPSEIYLELGFEDFSHFTFAFRKEYGAAPSKIQAAPAKV